MQTIMQSWTVNEIRSIRFAVGLTLTTVLAFTISWPVSFVSALLVGKILSTNKPCLPIQEGLGLVASIAISMLGGLVVSLTLLNYPVVFMLIITVILYWVFYLGTRGVSPVLIIMMLIGFTVIPFLGLQSLDLAFEATKAFIFSGMVAVVLVWISYALFPRKYSQVVREKSKKSHGNYVSAAKSTIVVIPVLVYVFLANQTDAVLILIFLSLLAQNTEFEAGVKGGLGLVIGNLGGGVIGIVVFNLLVIVPAITFFVLVMMAVWLFISQHVFDKTPKAALFGVAMSTIIVVLSASFGLAGTEATSTVFTRVSQLALVALYIAMSFSILGSSTAQIHKNRKRDVQAFR